MIGWVGKLRSRGCEWEGRYRRVWLKRTPRRKKTQEGRQAGRQSVRQAGKQTDRQAKKQAGRQADKQVKTQSVVRPHAPPRQELGDLRPLVPQPLLRLAQHQVLLFGPLALLHRAVQVVQPAVFLKLGWVGGWVNAGS